MHSWESLLVVKMGHRRGTIFRSEDKGRMGRVEFQMSLKCPSVRRKLHT